MFLCRKAVSSEQYRPLSEREAVLFGGHQKVYKGVYGASVILIQDLLVRPEYQRKGIGSQLMRAVLERCEDVYQIELMTDNTEKTILFYQSLGLKKVDEIGCCAFLKM